MNQQRALGWLMLCVEAGALALLSRTLLFPTMIAVISLAAAIFPMRVALGYWRSLFLVAGVMGVFISKAMLFPHEFPAGTAFYGSSVTHAMAQFFLIWQTGWFFVTDARNRLPLSFPALGATAILCMANVIVAPAIRDGFQVLVVAFVMLVGLFFAASRTILPGTARGGSARVIALGVICLVLGGTSWYGAHALEQYEAQIERGISRILLTFSPPSAMGFSGTAELGSVARTKSNNSENVALRITSRIEPGYLRGQAYDLYRDDTWRCIVPNLRIERAFVVPRNMPTPGPGMNLFVYGTKSDGPWEKMEFWPTISARSLFTPSGTMLLHSPSESLKVDDHHIFERFDARGPSSYSAFVPCREPISKTKREPLPILLEVPRKYENPDHPVARMAKKLFAGTDDPVEKMRRVENYFRANYTYQFGIHPPEDRDKLDWFLLERPPAHCEYFACGAAILLRLGGVPCRYVTGFVAHERNDFADYWIARNRDAHAWVEAWEPGRGWIIVEATPAAGLPSANQSGRFAQLWESLKGRTAMIWKRLLQGGFQAGLEQLWDTLLKMPRLLLSCFLIGGVWLTWRIRSRRGRSVRLDPRLRDMHRLKRRVDARLRRIAIERHPSETLHRFADRILAQSGDDAIVRAAAGWYRRYATLRYRGSFDAKSLTTLRENFPS